MSNAKPLTLLLLVASLALPAFATASPSVTVSAPRETIAPSVMPEGAKPPASARAVRCVSSPFSDARRIVFRARMSMFTDTMGLGQKRQMRFDIYRKYNEHKRYKRIKAEGLSVWHEGSDPMAGIYQRDVALAEPETAAKFYAKVSFRWIATDGKTVDFKRKIVTKPCKMKTALPRLAAISAKHGPVAGTTDHNYRVTISSRGGAEAENVPVHVSIDGAPSIVTMIESIAPGQLVDVQFNAPACGAGMAIAVDPLRALRLQFKRRPVLSVPC